MNPLEFKDTIKRAVVEAIAEAVGRNEPRPPSARQPDVVSLTLTESALAAGGSGKQIPRKGTAIRYYTGSHAAALLEVRFAEQGDWLPLSPAGKVGQPGGATFDAFWLRLANPNYTPASGHSATLLVMDADLNDIEDAPRAPQISDEGSAQSLLRGLNPSGDEVALLVTSLGNATIGAYDTYAAAYSRIESYYGRLYALVSGFNLAGAFTALRLEDNGAVPIAGWDGSAYRRLLVSAAGWLSARIIAGQDGITGGAGAVSAATPRVTLASDDPAVASLAALDDWDEADRAKVNVVAGQAGVAAGAGAVGANVLRTVEARKAGAVTQGKTSVPNTSTDTSVLSSWGTDVDEMIVKNAGTNRVFIELNGAGSGADANSYPLDAGQEIRVRGSYLIAGWNNGAAACDVHWIGIRY